MTEDTLKMNILLVDDSSMARKMFSTMIRAMQLGNVVTAADGAEAVDILKGGEKFDLIVSDWNMPRMDGLLFLKWVRSNRDYDSVPFLMATAQGERKQVLLAMENGADNVLPKPFTRGEFADRIKEVFKGDSHWTVRPKERVPRRDEEGRLILSIAHMAYSDNLILGVLEHLIAQKMLMPSKFTLEMRRMSSWNQVQESLEDGDVDGGLVLAPMAVDVFGCGVPVKLVLLTGRGGSKCVRNTVWASKSGGTVKEMFTDKVVLIPHKLSVQHMIMHDFLLSEGLKPGYPGPHHETDCTFEVITPVKMPEFMAYNESAAACISPEPIAYLAVEREVGEVLFATSEKWDSHPSCVVALRNEVIEEDRDAVQEFVDYMVFAGRYLAQRKGELASMAVKFLDPFSNLRLTEDNIKEMMDGCMMRTDDLVPDIEELDRMQRYMFQRMNVGDMVNLKELVDLSFAESFSK